MLNDLESDKYEYKKHAQRLLEKYKEIEKNTELHKMRLDDKTVVYCKDTSNFDRYRRKLKENIICRT